LSTDRGTATAQLIDLALHLTRSGEIGDGMVAQIRDLAERALVEPSPNAHPCRPARADTGAIRRVRTAMSDIPIDRAPVHSWRPEWSVKFRSSLEESLGSAPVYRVGLAGDSIADLREAFADMLAHLGESG
jgi:hypothetical protein